MGMRFNMQNGNRSCSTDAVLIPFTDPVEDFSSGHSAGPQRDSSKRGESEVESPDPDLCFQGHSPGRSMGLSSAVIFQNSATQLLGQLSSRHSDVVWCSNSSVTGTACKCLVSQSLPEPQLAKRPGQNPSNNSGFVAQPKSWQRHPVDSSGQRSK
ncbi:hypothetical protein CDAR_450411 [Caerostris darwini]|uniref:Uncharacterized protein n=1 Tax=Caerostris darwini TaxID=1538125 RepID=A0AAV4NDM1_9ARAC|nr:hypothetical protein CDAR_450411 [Caerostris darwini]